jgi:hypothetical protein
MVDPHLVRPVYVLAGTWCRVHPYDPATRKYGPTSFNDGGLGNARFSPLTDPTTGAVIPTMYLAHRVRGAISETLLHDVPEPSSGYIYDWERDRNSTLCVSTIALPELKLANLTSTGLRAAGLTSAGLFDCAASVYPTTRALAVGTWQADPTVQGVCWMSVRDNQSMAMVLFGDRVDPGLLAAMAGPTPIAQFREVVFTLLDELGCGLAPYG